MTPHSFDIAKAVAFDVECYPGNRWCVGFHGISPRTGKLGSHVVDRDRKQLGEVLARIARGGQVLVGYNSTKIDLPVIRGILAGFDPYPLAQSIIAEDRLPPAIGRLPSIEADHVDLSARVRRGGGFPSLKAVAANLGRPVLRELPYPHDAILDDEQWDRVKAYNVVDLGHTWALLEHFAPELQALAELSQVVGRDVRSTPTPRVTEVFFQEEYRRRTGGEPVPPGVAA